MRRRLGCHPFLWPLRNVFTIWKCMYNLKTSLSDLAGLSILLITANIFFWILTQPILKEKKCEEIFVLILKPAFIVILWLVLRSEIIVKADFMALVYRWIGRRRRRRRRRRRSLKINFRVFKEALSSIFLTHARAETSSFYDGFCAGEVKDR